MAHHCTGSALAFRLRRHVATAAPAAALSAAIVSTSAHATIQHRVLNLPIAADVHGLYINVESGVSGTSATQVAGWDLNPYGPSTLTFYNAAGAGVMRTPGATSGSAGNLAPLTPIDDGASFGSGSVVFGAAAGQWRLNSLHTVGFRFVASDGLLHFGWARIEVGATSAVRTLVDLAWEDAPLITIAAGAAASTPPAYDPCAASNPVLAAGANSMPLLQSTALNLDLRGSSCAFILRRANLFRLVASVSGEYTVSTCASGASTRLAVLDRCSADPVVVACNEDACGQASSLTFQATAGQTYFVAVGGQAPRGNLPSPLAITGTPPPEPGCVSGGTLQFGSNSFGNALASADAAVRSSASGASATIHKAVWYRFTPAVTGAYSFGMCGSVNDSMMALADTCPPAGGRLESIAFNDDACACATGCAGTFAAGLHSSNLGIPLDQPLVAGQTYYLAVGSFHPDESVTAIIEVDGPDQPSGNPADLNGDGRVDAQDITILLSAWGQPGVADLDGSGAVGSADIAILLNAWG